MSERILHRLESVGFALLEIVDVDRLRIDIRSVIMPSEHVYIFKEMLPDLIKALQDTEQEVK